MFELRPFGGLILVGTKPEKGVPAGIRASGVGGGLYCRAYQGPPYFRSDKE